MKKGISSRIATIVIIAFIVAGATGTYLSVFGVPGAGTGPAAETGRPDGTGRHGGPGGAGRTGGPGGPGGPGGAAPATAVQVHEIKTGTIERGLRTYGEVQPNAEVEVYSDVNGRIVRYLVKEGDYVQSGRQIALVDPSKPGQSFSANPVSAPLSGTITSLPRVSGDTVTSQTALAVISDLSVLKIQSRVPERYAASMKRGLAARLGFVAFEGEVFDARVQSISPVLDSQSRSLEIELRFDTADRRIQAGMYADIRLILEQRKNVPVLPIEAVQEYEDQDTVFVVDEENRARRRTVELGLSDQNGAEVLSGLEIGERVVIKGQSFLEEGDPVRIIDMEEL